MDNDGASATTSTCASAPSATFLDVYLKRFVNRVDVTMRFGRGHWYHSQQPLSRSLLEQAIGGVATLGLHAVSKRGTCKWLCLDGDDTPTFRGLASIALTLDADNVLLERSRRGGHLWLFCPPTPWQQVEAYGRYLVREYALQKVDRYPASGELRGIKAPMSRHPRTGKVYPFIDPKTGEVLRDSQAVIERLTPRPLPRVRLYPSVRYRRAPVIADATGLVDLASRYTQLRHLGGDRYQARCPLHRPDRHPSFSIVSGYWRCWAQCCGEGRSHGGVNALRARLRGKGLL